MGLPDWEVPQWPGDKGTGMRDTWRCATVKIQLHQLGCPVATANDSRMAMNIYLGHEGCGCRFKPRNNTRGVTNGPLPAAAGRLWPVKPGLNAAIGVTLL